MALRNCYRLPTELWENIYQYPPLNVPGEFATGHQEYSPFNKTASEQDFEDQYREYIQARAAITMVCKVWHQATLHFLFESIRLTPTNFVKALRILREPKTGPYWRCRFIRHIKVKLDRDSAQRCCEKLKNLIPFCSNLITYIHHNADQSCEGLTSTLFIECSASLRAVHLQDFFISSDLRRPLSATRLQTLVMTECAFLSEPEYTQDVVVLRSLRNLAYHIDDVFEKDISHLFLAGKFPNLNRFTPMTYEEPELTSDERNPYTPRARNLKILDLRGYEDSLNSILQSYPSIETLMLPGLVHPTDLMAPVNGSRLQRVEIDYRDCNEFLLAVIAVLADPLRFPRLRSIRLLNVACMDLKLFDKRWKLVFGVLKHRSIRFEDFIGAPIQLIGSKQFVHPNLHSLMIHPI